MRLFEISPNNTTSGIWVNATHKWAIPGIKCPACGTTWANTGLAYPRVDLSDLPCVEAYQDQWPIAPDRFDKLRDKVLPLVPPKSLVLPGTEFGPLTGDIQGQFDHAVFIWVNPWTLLLRRDAQQYFHNSGVLLPITVDTNLTYKGEYCSTLMELQIEARASILQDDKTKSSGAACFLGGYRLMLRPEPLVIQETSLPDDLDLFRPKEFTTLILATERFFRVCQEFEMTDLLFRVVQLG